jgi:hypothetical protein
MIVKTKKEAKKIIRKYVKECSLFDLVELVSCIYPNTMVQVGSKADDCCLKGGRLQSIQSDSQTFGIQM